MTIVNIVKTAEAVHVFSDTRATVDGWAVANVAKAMPLPHINCAVASRGPVTALAFAAAHVTQAKDWKDIRRILEAEMPRERHRKTSAEVQELFRHDFDIFVAGFDKDGPQALAIFSHSKHGIAAWKAVDLGHLLVTPTISDAEFQSLADDSIKNMPQAMALQAIQNPTICGGKIIETIVKADGIHSRSLGRLPEKKLVQPIPTMKLPNVFAKHQSVK